MFKIAKLETLKNEEIEIEFINQTHYNGKIKDEFSTLCFDIKGTIGEDKYFFSFCLNCRPEKLLEITDEKKADFTSYILEGNTYLTINGITDIDPKIKASVIRFLKNNFGICIDFFTDSGYDEVYSGQIEIEFNLDDYLNKQK